MKSFEESLIPMDTTENESAGARDDSPVDEEDRRVLFAALDSFLQYRRVAHYNVTHLRRQSFYALPSSHWMLLSSPPFSILDTLSAVDDAIAANADIAEAIVYAGLSAFGISATPTPTSDTSSTKPIWPGTAKSSDLDKARSTIRQIYRDWSIEGAAERNASHVPVLSTLRAEFSSTPDAQKGNIKVLVPGAGLGRLAFEICKAGFSVEGNEISYHQLLASSLILNNTKNAHQYPLYPWALSFSNHTTRAHQLEKIMIPDVHPGSELDAASEGKDTHAFQRLGMSAGDFCITYKEDGYKDTFDAITTVFFIDTAPNLIAYIETIHHSLKPGGIWINVGPLLWHFENNAPGSHGNNEKKKFDGGKQQGTVEDEPMGIAEPGAVELADDEVIKLVEHFGFAIEKHETGAIATGYTQSPHSMLQNIYRPSFWVARKK
ncbi:methyltransferase family [Aulographum hederae CBS 113979]|uniref:carnosine N-methyltransferase n=1 Tax=Aulographum hederae CBS 113979 TaxID=1176131 RepID=A0A6G1H170_9PEZI|nr:methyltransferase family [Aulographum hederae CBS 113979]